MAEQAAATAGTTAATTTGAANGTAGTAAASTTGAAATDAAKGSQTQGTAGATGAGGTTVLSPSTEGAVDPSKPVAAVWGEDWRETYAKEDAGRLSVLKRYSSPQAVLDALFAARQKIESGDLKAPLPKNATPEQIAAYRADNGVPDKPEGYLAALPDAVKLSDYDKSIIEPYLKGLHDENISPALVHKFIALRQAEHERMIGARNDTDLTLQRTTEDGLRAEWGNEYRANINNIHAMLDGAPAEVKDALLQARTPDGNPLVGTPQMLHWLSSLSREVNPFGTIVSGAGGNIAAGGVEARISEINGLIAKPGSEYWKGDKAEKIQAEYRQLIDMRDNMKRKVAA